MDDSIGDNVVSLHPSWKQAIEDFISARFPYGTVVPHEWFWEHFRLEAPGPTTPHKVAETAKFEFMRAFDPFQKTLLEDQQIALRSRRGVGYEVVHPSEQTGWAEDEAHDDMLALFRTAGRRLGNVRLEELDETQRAQNAAAMARLAQKRAIMLGRNIAAPEEKPKALAK